MKKLISVLMICVFAVSMSAFAVKKINITTKNTSKEVTVKQTKGSTKEATGKQKKGSKFTTSKNKVRQTRILQDLQYENSKKNTFVDDKQKKNIDATSPQQF